MEPDTANQAYLDAIQAINYLQKVGRQDLLGGLQIYLPVAIGRCQINALQHRPSNNLVSLDNFS